MAVARVTTIVASSKTGWQNAVQEGFKRASKTLRGITGLQVMEQTAHVEGGKITEYRVRMNIIFLLEK